MGDLAYAPANLTETWRAIMIIAPAATEAI